MIYLIIAVIFYILAVVFGSHRCDVLRGGVKAYPILTSIIGWYSVV